MAPEETAGMRRIVPGGFERSYDGGARVERLTGDLVVDMAAAALSHLQQDEARINALNVFPVPDGDTASNMILTLKAAIDAVGERDSLAQVAEAMARGALRGARGNSGTILSQFLYGFHLGVKGLEAADALQMARAFEQASQAAYSAVHDPKEGTILTVGRRWAECAMAEAENGSGLTRVFEAALQGALHALEETPKLLEILGEAGVVDAGGEGFVVCLQGALAVLRGERVQRVPRDLRGAASNGLHPALALHAEVEDAHHRDAISLAEITYAYCTEFLVQGEGLSVEAFKKALMPLGDSLIVVGDERLIKVHVHTNRPGQALEIACDAGDLLSVSVVNMKEQNREHVISRQGGIQGQGAKDAGKAKVAVVAVAMGKGFEEILKDQGVTAIVPGGQSMNPSAGELVDAIEATGAEHVILLPNNKNILLTAEQASALTQTPVTVVATTSLPQAVAASLHFDPALPAKEVAGRMGEAAAKVRTAELTRAMRDARFNGATIHEGDVIAMSDGKLLASSKALEEALVDAVRGLGPKEGDLVTLYFGEGVTDEDAKTHRRLLQQEFPACEIEAYFGGQPVYLYLISVE